VEKEVKEDSKNEVLGAHNAANYPPVMSQPHKETRPWLIIYDIFNLLLKKRENIIASQVFLVALRPGSVNRNDREEVGHDRQSDSSEHPPEVLFLPGLMALLLVYNSDLQVKRKNHAESHDPKADFARRGKNGEVQAPVDQLHDRVENAYVFLFVAEKGKS